VELQLAPMFPLGFAFMRISIGTGQHHAVKSRAALLVTEGGQEEAYEEQSCEEYCHRSPNRIRQRMFCNWSKKELASVEWVGFGSQYKLFCELWR